MRKLCSTFARTRREGGCAHAGVASERAQVSPPPSPASEFARVPIPSRVTASTPALTVMRTLVLQRVAVRLLARPFAGRASADPRPEDPICLSNDVPTLEVADSATLVRAGLNAGGSTWKRVIGAALL